MVKKKNAKKQQNKQLKSFLMLILILGIIFVSFLFFDKISNYFNNKKIDNNNYNGFDFYFDETQNLWFTQIQIGKTPYNIPFYYHPKDLENIIVQENIEDVILKDKPQNIIISVPSNSSSEMAIAGIEISKITGERYQVLKIPTTSAFSSPVEGMPFATCSQSNAKTVVILFKESNKNVITGTDNCIVLEFKKANATKIADSLSYHLLKIM